MSARWEDEEGPVEMLKAQQKPLLDRIRALEAENAALHRVLSSPCVECVANTARAEKAEAELAEATLIIREIAIPTPEAEERYIEIAELDSQFTHRPDERVWFSRIREFLKRAAGRESGSVELEPRISDSGEGSRRQESAAKSPARRSAENQECGM